MYDLRVLQKEKTEDSLAVSLLTVGSHDRLFVLFLRKYQPQTVHPIRVSQKHLTGYDGANNHHSDCPQDVPDV